MQKESSEVGAVIIVGGNIDHLTRVMTTTITMETSKGELSLALALGIILLITSITINLIVTYKNITLRIGIMEVKNTLMPIKVKKLNFEKGQRKLLTDISCEIKAKGITIILGPNGAGKTLFLKFLHGLISDSTFEVTFANKTLNTSIRKQQSMVFQSPILLRRSVFKKYFICFTTEN